MQGMTKQKYMQYKKNSFVPVLEVIDELLLVQDKIHQKKINDTNNKLTQYEHAIILELNYWMRGHIMNM